MPNTIEALRTKRHGRLGRGLLAAVWRLAGLSLALCLAGCATGRPGPASDRSALDEEFAVPFLYRGLGVGAQPRLGIVQLEQGDEARMISQALLEAMQEMEMSFVEPPASLTLLIAPEETWRTGITPLPLDLVRQHNAEHPEFPLPLDRLYAIQYVGSYVIHERQLRFRLESHLYHRGLGGNFRPYAHDTYSSKFFFERVKLLIEERLAQLSAPEA